MQRRDDHSVIWNENKSASRNSMRMRTGLPPARIHHSPTSTSPSDRANRQRFQGNQPAYSPAAVRRGRIAIRRERSQRLKSKR